MLYDTLGLSLAYLRRELDEILSDEALQASATVWQEVRRMRVIAELVYELRQKANKGARITLWLLHNHHL